MTSNSRETFTSSRFGLLATMIGVAVGLGNVWRFPYMAGKFGGAPFVLFYVFIVVIIGIPALMAEWTLGRHTRQGPVGAFYKAGLPFGKYVGWFFFLIIFAAVGYYTNAVGWVLFHAVTELLQGIGLSIDGSQILPPNEGFVFKSFFLQICCTMLVILACVFVLLKGIRSGIEKSSKFIMPMLLIILLILIGRSLTLPGAFEGVQWYILKFEMSDLTGKVMLGALGQAVFSLSLGGTFMVVYGSYLNQNDDLKSNAIWTASGDVIAGLLAGLAIIPAVFALGLEPSSGPGLIFSTLPGVFDQIPLGWLFGFFFFAGLFGAAYLSNVAGYEVLIAGLTDNTSIKRKKAVWLIAGIVFFVSIPPMINMKIFVPWDLTFGSGMQTIGSLLTVITVGWVIKRANTLKELGLESNGWLYYWLKFVIPIAILAVGIWWVLTDLLGVFAH